MFVWQKTPEDIVVLAIVVTVIIIIRAVVVKKKPNYLATYYISENVLGALFLLFNLISMYKTL